MERSRRNACWVCLALVALTTLTYWPVTTHGFVNYDDQLYVTQNPVVRSGLGPDSVKWAFTSIEGANWHPLTWLSHLADYELFGPEAGWHHLHSLVLHDLSTVLLLLFLLRATGALWTSAFVAAAFALHPLHVESVAWIAERKDVLSTLFGFLALLAFTHYAETRERWAYGVALAAFTLSLMAKPMLVTLPCVLLLMDYWPHRRLNTACVLAAARGRFREAPGLLGLLLEKAPFFLLALTSSVVTVYAQGKSGAVASMGTYGLGLRLRNAAVAYVGYIAKAVWPSRLAVFYPHPEHVPLWWALGAVVILAALTLVCMRRTDQRRYLMVGWLWYLGTLVPVIGLVQVGDQAMADRYAYVPLVGLAIILAWGAAGIGARWRPARLAIPAAAATVLLGWVITTRRQLRHWRSSEALFSHALQVTRDNALAHRTLGLALFHAGDVRAATRHFREALRVKPSQGDHSSNLGLALARQGEYEGAAEHFARALELAGSASSEIRHNLGMALRDAGDLEGAVSHLREVLRIKPRYAKAHYSLGKTLLRKGETAEAIACFQRALSLGPDEPARESLMAAVLLSHQKPDYGKIHHALASAYAKQGDLDAAVKHYSEALGLKPGLVDALVDLGVAHARQRKYALASARFEEALRREPGHSAAKTNLVMALTVSATELRDAGKLREAIDSFSRALRVKPGDEDTRRRLAVTHTMFGAALGNKGDLKGAIAQFESALGIDPGCADAQRNLRMARAAAAKAAQ